MSTLWEKQAASRIQKPVDAPKPAPAPKTAEEAPKPKKAPKKAAKKPTLKVGDDNWDKVVKDVQANKDKGVFEDLVKMLETKYTKLSQSVIKELKNYV